MLSDIADLPDDEYVPIPNMKESTFIKLMSYCQQYQDTQPHSDDDNSTRSEWEFLFCKKMTREDVEDVLLAADILDIQSLIDLMSKHYADTFIAHSSIPGLYTEFKVSLDSVSDKDISDVLEENPWLKPSMVLDKLNAVDPPTLAKPASFAPDYI